MSPPNGKQGNKANLRVFNHQWKNISAIIVSCVVFIGAAASFFADIDTIKNFIFNTIGIDDIQLITSLETEPCKKNENLSFFDQHEVIYDSMTKGNEVQIYYKTDYSGQKQAKVVGIGGEGPFFSLPKIGIDFKIVNNSKKSIFITDAILEVETSHPNNEPLMVLIDPYMISEIVFLNDGWGEPKEVILSSSIISKQNGLQFKELTYRKEKSKLYENITEYYFEITPLLELHGFSSEKIKQSLFINRKIENLYDEREKYEIMRIDSNELEINLDKKIYNIDNQIDLLEKQIVPMWDDIHKSYINAFGSNFSQEDDANWVDVVGNLLYKWNDFKNIEHSRKIDFEQSVLVTPPDGVGAPGFEATGTYEVQLKTEGNDYEIHKPISQTIEAGKFDRFILWVGAPQSSVHKFLVRIKYNENKQLVSKIIYLDYLMPRSNRKMLE